MKEPLFSVIVSTHERPLFLREALGSIQRQTIDEFECIVVDDSGSSSVDIPDDDRFRLIRRTREGGLPASLNDALDEARGRYVTFLDDDDLYTEDRLELGLAGVAESDLAICWRANAATGIAGKNRRLGADAHDEILLRSIPLRGQATIAREIVCSFDENLVTSSDLEWWLRMTERSGIQTVPKVGLHLRRHPGPRLSRDFIERVKARAYILEKHSRYFADHPAATARFLHRMGLLAQAVGDHATARTALWRSLKLGRKPKTAFLLARSLRPSTNGVAHAGPLAASRSASEAPSADQA